MFLTYLTLKKYRRERVPDKTPFLKKFSRVKITSKKTYNLLGYYGQFAQVWHEHQKLSIKNCTSSKRVPRFI
jgi:hypothetical protein